MSALEGILWNSTKCGVFFEKVTATMADGTTVTTTKNAHGNVTKSTIGNKMVTNTYDADQQLTKTVDSVSGETSLTYDDKGKVISVITPDHSESFVYDDKDVLTSKTVDGTTYEFAYKATADKALDSLSVDGNTVRPHTDALGRNTGKTVEVGENKIAEEKISYVKFGDHATSLPSNVRFATNGVFNESIQYTNLHFWRFFVIYLQSHCTIFKSFFLFLPNSVDTP